MKNWVKKAYSGAITVEASYICVFAVYIIILLLYIAFYCHDSAVIRSDISYIAQISAKSSLKWLDIESKSVDWENEFSHILNDSWEDAGALQGKIIEEKALEMIQAHILFCKIDQLSIEKNYNYLMQKLECRVSVSGYLKFPVPLFGKEKLTFQEKCTITEIDVIKALWLKETLMDGGS